MKAEHLSIGGLMVLVGVSALGWGALTALLDLRQHLPADYPAARELCALGVPPMGAVLAIALGLLLHRMGKSGICDPFLAGFIAAGALALAAFLGLTLWQGKLIVAMLHATLGTPEGREAEALAAAIGGPLALLAPQILVAFLGGTAFLVVSQAPDRRHDQSWRRTAARPGGGPDRFGKTRAVPPPPP